MYASSQMRSEENSNKAPTGTGKFRYLVRQKPNRLTQALQSLADLLKRQLALGVVLQLTHHRLELGQLSRTTQQAAHDVVQHAARHRTARQRRLTAVRCRAVAAPFALSRGGLLQPRKLGSDGVVCLRLWWLRVL